jgi:streptogramin lyase
VRCSWTFLALTLVSLTACDGCNPNADCVDLDHDGFGLDCARGADCDDTNPNYAAVCPDNTDPFVQPCEVDPLQPGCACDLGVAPRDCYAADPLTRDRGNCRSGTMTCLEGLWSPCDGAVLPETEVCDTLDNNCDGRVDEGLRSACDTCDLTCQEDAAGPAYGSDFEPPDEGSALAIDNDGALHLDVRNIRFDHIWIANSGENTVSKLSTETGREEGRYNMPRGCTDPSRTTVDIEGDVWVGCRGGGSIVKIAGAPRRCVDRNGNGAIETSEDSNDDGAISGGELLARDTDECVVLNVSIGGSVTRAAAVDANNNVWAGSWDQRNYTLIDGDTGEILARVDAGGNPYGAAMYGKTMYSSNRGGGTLARIDVTTRERTGLWNVPGCASLYGIAVDRYGHVWMGNYSCHDVLRFDPGNETWSRYSVGGGNSRGVAANAEGEVFVAVDGTNKVYKFDAADGSVLGVFDVGQNGVIGIALDDENMIWTVARNSQKATKMTDDGVIVGHYPVGRAPYTYSDMTGQALRTFAAPVGIYRIAYQSGCKYGTAWGGIDLDGETPEGTSLEVRLSIADAADRLMSNDAITYGPWRQDSGSDEFPADVGEVAEHAHAMLEVHFISESRELSPRLLGLQLQHHCIE